MSIGFSTILRNARAQAIIEDLDGGVAAGTAYVELYGGGSGRPATGVAITDQTLIGTLDLSDPSGSVTNGVLTFDVISDDVSADADEDIEWARFYDSDDVFVMDMGCGIAGSGQEVIFNGLTARIGGIIQMTSGSISEGNA